MSKETRTVSLDEENHEALSNHDNASAVVNDLVTEWRRGGDRGTAALRMQLRQKKRERELAKERFEKLDNDVEEIEAMLNEVKNEETQQWKEAKDALDGVPKDVNNPAIKNWARKLGVKPSELVAQIE